MPLTKVGKMMHDTEKEITKEKTIQLKTYWKEIIIKKKTLYIEIADREIQRELSRIENEKKETEVKIEVKMKERKPKKL